MTITIAGSSAPTAAKALLAQLNIPTYHFHHQEDAEELDAILKYTFMCNKPVAILTDANFWGGYGDQ